MTFNPLHLDAYHRYRRGQYRAYRQCVFDLLPEHWDVRRRVRLAGMVAVAGFDEAYRIGIRASATELTAVLTRLIQQVDAESCAVADTWERFLDTCSRHRSFDRDVKPRIEAMGLDLDTADRVFQAISATTREYRKLEPGTLPANRHPSPAAHFDLHIGGMLMASGLGLKPTARILATLRLQFAIETDRETLDKLTERIRQRLLNARV